VSLLLCFCLTISCKKHDLSTVTEQQSQRFLVNLTNTIQNNEQYTRFFIVSKFACQSCVERAIERFSQSPLRDSIGIIIIGEDSTSIERRKFMYFRQNVHFLYAGEKLYDTLEAIDKLFAMHLLYGIRRDKNQDRVYIHNGWNSTTKVQQEPDSVINFVLR